MAVEEIFLKLVQVWTIRERHQKRQRGGSTTRWRKCLMFIARDVKNGFRAARHVGAMEEGRRWCPVLETIFANLWAGGLRRGRTLNIVANPSSSETDSSKVLARLPWPWRWSSARSYRSSTQEWPELRGSAGARREFWAHVDDITISTTPKTARITREQWQLHSTLHHAWSR